MLDVSPRHDLDEGCLSASQRAEDVSDSSNRYVLHPRFNRIFLGLMSLGRCSNPPADVIPHVSAMSLPSGTP